MAKTSHQRAAAQAGRAPSRTTTKEKATKKRGKAIFKDRQIKRIKKSKQERAAKKHEADEKPKATPVLLRSEKGAEGVSEKPRRDSAFTDRMNVDDFMEHGFMQAMEDNEEDDDEDDEEDEEEDGEEEEESDEVDESEEDEPQPKLGKASKHKADLLALQKQDPAFFEYMKKTDPKLLNFTAEDEEDEEEDDDEDDDDDDMDEDEAAAAAEAFGGEDIESSDEEEDDEAEVESDEEEEMAAAPSKSKKAKVSVPLIEVTPEMVRGWQKALMGKENSASLKEVVTAFRAAVRFGDASNAEDEVYTFSSGHVFNLLMQFCLQHMDDMLRRHVAGSASAASASKKTKGGAERPDQWTHWKKHASVVKTYLTQLLVFTGQLTESAMIAVAIQQCHRLMPFFLVLPKLAPKLLKASLKAWSTDESSGGSQQITLLGFAIVRQLAVTLPYPFVESCFKGLYLAYAQAAAKTSRSTLPHIVLMASCFVDLCAVDAHAAYTHAFVYIRQLAIHLRNAIQKASPEASRQVYNWQFVNCMRLWAQVLCAHGRSTTAPLRQLVYPLVQVCLGTARLLPSIRYAALRLQCARILNQLSVELRIYIPVAPLLLEALQFSELSKSPKAAKEGKPLDWTTMVKASASECALRVYQEGMLHETLYCLAEHLFSMCTSISFPEMTAPTVLALRSAAKTTKIVALQKRCKRLLAQVETQAKYIAQKRDLVDFAPSDVAACADFLKAEREAESSPFAKWFAGERADAQRAETRRQEEAAAQAAGVKVDEDDDDGGKRKRGGDDEEDEEDEEEAPKKAKKEAKEAKAAKKKAKAKEASEAGKKAKKAKAKKGGDGSGVEDEVDELRMEDLESDSD